jgi:anaphase-promoting complex subunit 10
MVISTEIGSIANWSVSSSKASFGVNNLHDGKESTYWQSDGPQPHRCMLVFKTQLIISKVSIQLDFKTDESYTPSKISIHLGLTLTDLFPICEKVLNEPNGWIDFEIEYQLQLTSSMPMKVFFLQVVVMANHHDGKDTHVRQIKVFSPSRFVTLLTRKVEKKHLRAKRCGLLKVNSWTWV